MEDPGAAVSTESVGLHGGGGGTCVGGGGGGGGGDGGFDEHEALPPGGWLKPLMQVRGVPLLVWFTV
jgi:hypothetical protein